MKSSILVVDENDTVIGSKDRDALAPGDIYRVSALWLTNSRGEVLMAQRAYTKKKSPGAWGSAVAGTVEVGEEYDSNIVKEIQEEIGISIPIDRLVRVAKIRVDGEGGSHFVQWYTGVVDIPAEDFVIKKEEVEKVKWFPAEGLLRRIQEHPEEFTPSAPQWAGLFFN